MGNQTSDLLVCRPALNPLSHTGAGWIILNLVNNVWSHLMGNSSVLVGTNGLLYFCSVLNIHIIRG